MAELPLYPVNRLHLGAMTGDLGVWQHATGAVPNEAFGYCVDDVARALLVDLAHARVLGWDAVSSSAWQSLRFMRDAFDPVSGRFRNFRDADGTWLDTTGSEDSHGRALLALGEAVRDHPEAEFGANARMLFGVALPAASRLHALRATASTVLGCAAALDGPGLDPGLRDAAIGALAKLSARLRNAFAPAARDRGWPWPEPVLTYENALLPRALIVAGARTGDPGLSRLGLDALDWLNAVQTNVDGAFSPIGSDGFWRRGGPRARYDQQPIEATSMILAAEVAHAQTGERRYLEIVERAYAWFLGENDVGAVVADPATGGCFDGLEPAGVNRNQGAESTLMWLLALEHVRAIRRAVNAAPTWHAAVRPAVAPIAASRG